MEEMTVKTVREYLEKKNSIILPVGIIEQHGYHLPLATDELIAREISWMVAEETGVMVAPSLHTSFSGGGLPGTINISPSVMALVVRDVLTSLVLQGFKKIYIVLGHGGSQNLGALDNGLKVLLHDNPAFSDVMLALLPVWGFDSTGRGWSRALKEKDWHAGWIETSMVMAIAPELVDMEEMELDKKPPPGRKAEDPDNHQQAEKIVDDPAVVPRMSQRPDIKVGVLGRPAEASPALGREIVGDTVKCMSEKIKELEKKYDGKYKRVFFKPPPPAL